MGSPRTWASSAARCASGWPGTLPGVRPAPMAVRLSARCVHAGPTTPAGGQTQETASEPIARLEAANAEPHTQAVKLGPGSRWDPFSRRPSMSRWWRRSAKSLFPGSLRTTGTPMRSNGCGLVEVARSSYYAWRAGRPARERRSATDAALREPITRTAQDRPGHGLAQDHCITAGLNEATQEAGGRVNRKRVARLMHAAGTRRLPQAAPGAHHRAGPVRHGGAPTCSSVTSQPRPPHRYVGDIPPLRGRCPLLPAPGRRDEPVPGYRHRLRTADAWSPGRCATTCARPLGHRGPPAGRGAATQGSLKGAVFHLRPRIGLYLQGLRRRGQEARGDPVHGSSRLQRGRRAGRVIQCHVEA